MNYGVAKIEPDMWEWEGRIEKTNQPQPPSPPEDFVLGWKEKSWYPSDKSTIQMLMDVRFRWVFRCWCFPLS